MRLRRGTRNACLREGGSTSELMTRRGARFDLGTEREGKISPTKLGRRYTFPDLKEAGRKEKEGV